MRLKTEYEESVREELQAFGRWSIISMGCNKNSPFSNLLEQLKKNRHYLDMLNIQELIQTLKIPVEQRDMIYEALMHNKLIISDDEALRIDMVITYLIEHLYPRNKQFIWDMYELLYVKRLKRPSLLTFAHRLVDTVPFYQQSTREQSNVNAAYKHLCNMRYQFEADYFFVRQEMEDIKDTRFNRDVTLDRLRRFQTRYDKSLSAKSAFDLSVLKSPRRFMQIDACIPPDLIRGYVIKESKFT